MNAQLRKQAIEILANTQKPDAEVLIKQFVWANTAAPKYQIGDPVRFTPVGVSIHRNVPLPGGGWDRQTRRAGEVVGRIIEVRRLVREMCFTYRVEYETDLEEGTILNNHITSHTSFVREDQLKQAQAYAPTKWSEL